MFSDYPSNWELLLVNGIDSEAEAEKEARLAAEAELQALQDSKNEGGSPDNEKESTDEDLMKMSLKDLREKYPEVKATSIKAFVDKVLEL